MTTDNRPPLLLIPGNAHPELAEALALELRLPLEAAEITAFADGEIRPRILSNVRGATVCIVQPTPPPVNEHLMVLALLIDAARAAGAARVVAVVPYLAYSRQDQRGREGDPRSAQVVARLLTAVGLDHLVVLDLHAPALESALPMPVTLLYADEVFLPHVRSWELADLVLVAPDAGGLKRAQRYALALGMPLAVIAKDRPRTDVVVPLQVLGDVRERACLIVDDMASTGRTLAGAAGALRRAGAREVHALFTHAVMAPGAEALIQVAGFGRVLTTDSIPRPPTAWLETVTVVPLLAQTVRRLWGAGS